MKVVVVNKKPFNSTTFENVISIVYNSATENVTLTLTDNTTYTFEFSKVKIMII